MCVCVCVCVCVNKNIPDGTPDHRCPENVFRKKISKSVRDIEGGGGLSSFLSNT